jgi:hypothetical protein
MSYFREVTGNLGLTPKIEERDLWEDHRRFGLVVEPEEEELEEPEDIDEDAKDEEENWSNADDSEWEDDGDGDEKEDVVPDMWGDEAPVKSGKGKKMKPKKQRTSVDRVSPLLWYLMSADNLYRFMTLLCSSSALKFVIKRQSN